MNDHPRQGHEWQSYQDTYFDPGEGYLLVRLDKDSYGLPDEEIIFQGKVFQPKEELHITIVSSTAAERVQEQLEQHPEYEDRIRRLIDETDWSYGKLDLFYHVEADEGVESIIQMVEVAGIRDFYHQLSQLLEKELESPPSHVTLYTRGDPNGIGLPTLEVFDQLVKAESNPREWMPAGYAGRPGEP